MVDEVVLIWGFNGVGEVKVRVIFEYCVVYGLFVLVD